LELTPAGVVVSPALADFPASFEKYFDPTHASVAIATIPIRTHFQPKDWPGALAIETAGLRCFVEKLRKRRLDLKLMTVVGSVTWIKAAARLT
jgi:hypothetical protein